MPTLPIPTTTPSQAERLKVRAVYLEGQIDLKRFRFNPTTQEGESLTEVRRGTLAIVSGQIAKSSPDAMKVQTPTTILGVRGTTFAVKVEE